MREDPRGSQRPPEGSGATIVETTFWLVVNERESAGGVGDGAVDGGPLSVSESNRSFSLVVVAQPTARRIGSAIPHARHQPHPPQPRSGVPIATLPGSRPCLP
jgi:hypothetical protein